MKVPNMGINFPTVSAGLEYFPGAFPALDQAYVPDRKSPQGNSYLMFQIITGYKNVYSEDTWSWGVSSRFIRQLRTFYGLNAGAELIMDKGEKRMIGIEDKDVDYKRFAVTAGQDFYLGRVVFSQYLGFYLYSPYKAEAPVYQKYELSYGISPGVLFGVFLKAHAADAELFGFAVNYRVKL